MFWLKKCPRCSGDLFNANDQYGDFVTCMQGGFTKDLADRMADPGDISLEATPAPVVPKVAGGKRRRLSHGGRHFAKTFTRVEGLTADTENVA